MPLGGSVLSPAAQPPRAAPAATPAPPRSAPGRTGSAAETARVLGAAAIPTAVYFVVVLRHMTYAWDDFIQFGVTMRFGIGRELLTYGLFEHFGPTNRLAHGLLVTLGGLDTRWAIAVALPIFFLYCAFLTDLARLLGADWGRVALCLAVGTVTAATVSLGAVLDQYFHVMVTVAATACATAAYVRWTRTRRFVHAMTGALAVALACSVQERGVFIVVFLALARVLVIDGGVPPGLALSTWLRTWLRDLPFLAAPILVAAASATTVALNYVADAPRGELAETAVLVVRAWAELLVPMVTGAYGAGTGSGRLALLVLVNSAVAALAGWSIVRNAWNIRPWLLLLTWFGLLTAFLGLGRLGLGSVEALISDPQNCTYALPAVVVLITSLRRARTATPARDARRAGRRRALAQVGAAVVLACLMVISVQPAAGRSAQFAPGYLEASVGDVLAANDIGAAVIAPTRVPDALVPPGFFPYTSGELFLREIDSRTVVDLDPRTPFFLDASGHLTPGTAELLARLHPGAPGSGASVTAAEGVPDDGDLCVSADGAGRVNAPLPAPVDLPGGAVWVRLVAHGDSTEGSVAVGGASGWTLGAIAPFTTAHGSVTFVLPTAQVSEVALIDIRADRLCVEAIELWALSAAGPAGCTWVGVGGAAIPAVEGAPRPRCA